MPSFLVGTHLFVKVCSTKTVNTVRMYWRRQRLMHFVPFSQLEAAEAGADVISELAATVQPGGYSTVRRRC